MTMLCGHFWRTGFWVRIFGFGLSISTDKPLFSERYGHRKCLRIYGVKFEYLPRVKLQS